MPKLVDFYIPDLENGGMKVVGKMWISETIEEENKMVEKQLKRIEKIENEPEFQEFKKYWDYFCKNYVKIHNNRVRRLRGFTTRHDCGYLLPEED